MKKQLRAGAALLLAASITACSGGAAPSGTEQNGANGTQAAAGSTQAAAGGEARKIVLWGPSAAPAVEEWWTEKITEFNEEYAGQYELSRESIVRSNSYAYEDKINSAITSNDLPDILLLDGPNVASYAANGIIVPIDDYIAREDKDDLVASSLEQNTYNNVLYAMGNTESSVALFYNKDMIEAAGIKVPESLEDAWTWSQFYDIAKQLTTDEVAGTNIIMDKGEGIPYVMEQFWISNGTDFTNPEGSKADGYLNSEKGVEAAAFLNSFIQDGLANIEPIPKEFHNGKAATALAGCWEVVTLNNEYPDLNWGVTYFPVADEGIPSSPTGDWTMTITKDSKDPEAAAVALNFLTSKENAASYAQAQGKPPARKSSYDVLTQYDEMPMAIFKEQLLNTGHARPRTPSYTVLSPQISEAMMNIFTGADIQESLDKAAQAFDKDYEKNYAQ